MHLKHGAALQGGKYRIVKVLGAGSFGVTYLAKTKVVGNFGAIETSVAIKEFFASELNTRLADGSVREMSGNSLASKYMKKFAEEADKISLLKEHPGIVKVLETFSENNTCYYVMEYKDGGSLREYVDGNGGVPESEAIEMIRKIGDALSYMHSRKMLHLDLKPGNVMMDSDGSLCLIDFGLSRHFENEESESTTGIGLGTVGYAPIEQAGYNSSDVRKDIPVTIDIYALGATFSKILTGKTPPPSYELLQSFPSAALEAKGVSAKTMEAIKKAMSPIPSFRPQTVSEFLLMLDKDYKPSVPSVAEEEKTEIFLYPEPSQAPETINEDSHEGDKSQVQHKEEEPKKKSRRWLWWVLAGVVLVGVGVFAVMSSMSGDETAVASTDVRAVPQHEIDKAAYDSLMAEVSSITLDDLESCHKAMALYGEALVYEEKYVATEYRSMFSGGASEQILNAGIAAEMFEAEAEAQKARAEQAHKQYEADLKDYNAKMDDADKKSRSDEKSLKEAKKLYEEAAKYETNYKGTEYASFFVKGALARAKDMQSLIDNIQKSKPQPAPAPSPKTGTYKGHEWVDLGLSVKWATCNVGASTPGRYGNYYAWGETSTKSNYGYDNSASYGKSWSDIGGNSSRDAATANWGGSWRMPTKAEFQELIDNCTWTWTTQNGHKGYKVTGKNGQSIFLPAAGYRRGATLNGDGEDGYYWSSTPYESYTDRACIVYFFEGGRNVNEGYRYNARSVRPVLED